MDNRISPFVWFMGVVEETNDPEALGRVRVRIFGVHTDDKKKIPTDKLPWASPIMPLNSASIGGVGTSPVGALEGAWVIGFARDQDRYQDLLLWGSVPGVAPKKEKDHATTGFVGDLIPADEELMFGSSKPGESDLNRLATGRSTDKTTVKTQGDTVQETVNSSEPKSAYATKYPNNTVTFTRSGHYKEIDDTSGAERLKFCHRSGSFEEYHPDGSRVERVVKDSYEIIEGDCYLYIKGNSEWDIEGNVTIDVGENINFEIAKTLDVLSGTKITNVGKKIRHNP